jgi:putative component of toxin-antitoxin plasmid stabilization module
MYQSKYYQDENGRQPFNDWRQKLKKKGPRAVSKVDNSIDRAEAGEIILLLIGGTKKSQDGDLDKAVSYLQDYKARSKNDSD